MRCARRAQRRAVQTSPTTTSRTRIPAGTPIRSPPREARDDDDRSASSANVTASDATVLSAMLVKLLTPPSFKPGCPRGRPAE
jgi:hypothetical protein